MLFSIFTHVEHLKKNKHYLAYSPYVREMNLWLKHVDRVKVVAPYSEMELNGAAEYEHSEFYFSEIPGFNLLSLKGVFLSFFKIPFIGWKLIENMKRADHIHLRCPGNIGLIACICQIFFPNKPKTAKYAGNWDPNAKQPWSYRLQKWILKNPFLTRNMTVLVYGDWPGQTANIKPFFTASFSENEIKQIREKTFSTTFTFLFVGNLVPGKRPIEAIQLVHGLKESGSRVNLEIYGHGPERDNLESYCRENNLQGDVKFHGNRSLEELKAAYQNAHFVILPSRSEGWPKALAEGMFFGCIPIATPVSCVPWMLGEGSRGVLITNKANGQRPTGNGSKKGSVDSGQWAVDIEKILCLLRKPEEMQRMSMEAKRWSQQYTLERFEERIKEVLSVRGLNKSAETGKLSPAPFRDGVKRGKN
ncbi:glycosyltransferase family 4 protein [Salinimicrobium gaetbulicola]|uniref:Glycosyltransferase family 4 protein n=1 Tax=Salinimicrobium gaetbulicola TaxID=999702 RepID=A0ABW3IIZ6_9FLAO